ncbi:L,D-transpeptidase [Salipiger abyssi]|uniref:Ykud domain-containing protein n=1 Tax=Salipiger abyssi TaxID=1250539 RepID=A0A1P8V017_9RHOB|nr:L,D-transpeptidase [Salipiger abyssi]APZ54992.1 Ykud domain-containing protein [Salipiger abyssi]
MRVLFAALALLLWLSAGAAQAQSLWVEIDLSDQQMVVFDRGAAYVWPVSTARAGKVTPVGSFTPYALERMHYSTLYHNAPMPWSIFFRGNYAIHGTTAVDRLGTPASAGCVRLAPENARVLFEAVQVVGLSETRIVIRP